MGPKGTRTKLACDLCRTKKRKCDGQEPCCNRCLQQGDDCEYSFHLDRRRPYTKKYVNSLKERIRRLELTLASGKNGAIDIQEEQEANEATYFVSDPKRDSTHDESNLNRRLNMASTGNITHLKDTYFQFKCQENKTFFYGPRSNLSFIEGNIPLTSTNKISDGGDCGRVADITLIPSGHELYLCGLYFAFPNVSFHFLWEKLFYDQLRQPASSRNINFITESLVNAVMAVGSLFDHSVNAESAQAIRYTEKARRLLQEELRAPTIPTVQSCGLLAIFYISQNEDCLAWYYCGAAISSAYSLGLNMDEYFSDTVIAPDEAELRRMAFWAIYTLERTLNTMLGRPTFLKTESIFSMVPTGAGISDQSQWWNICKNNQFNMCEKIFARSFSLVTYTVELLITASKALDDIYLDFKPTGPSELQLIVNKVSIELFQFESGLPEFLRLPFILSSKSRKFVSPGPYIFQMRYHSIQILLHRVFFIRDRGKTLDDPNVCAHMNTCFESACIICKLVFQYEIAFGLEYFDICAVDIVCSAGTVLLYLLKHPKIFTEALKIEPTMQTCKNNYVRLKDALSFIARTNKWADKNMNVLNQLEKEWDVHIRY